MGCGATSQRYAADDEIPASLAAQEAPRAQSTLQDAIPTTVETAGYRQQSSRAPAEVRRVVSASSAAPPAAIPSSASQVKLPSGVRVLALEDFEQLDMLDETPMSSVFRLRHKRTGAVVAGKRIRKGCDTHRSGDYLNEVSMLQKLCRAPNVVSLHGVCDQGLEFWTVMELCPGGRLEPWLQKFPNSARNVARQLLEAIGHLHGRLICHLDLKPDNVLLSGTGDVRVCDFVTACQLQAAGQQLMGNCGTDNYRAPEVASGGAYSGLKADVFSLGRTCKAIEKADPTWQQMTRAARHMTDQDPQNRPAVSGVQAALFAEPDGSRGRMVVDWDSLESVSCQEALSNSSAALKASPFPSSTMAAATAAAVAARPPPMLQRQNQASQNPRVQPQQHEGGDGARRRTLGAPLQPKQAIGGKAAGKAGRAAKKCNSSLCQRLGQCLCNDQVPLELAMARPQDRVGAQKGLRRCNTP
eukprot:TRINITY_DN34149_c0_g1_i1.p1 TRINITY_DN34149_c0_g1~~TRINITY_DN34149_c0_g1_i1.p1  ORF type:complete len:470 (-),score=92.75 TRINITY_DN34149_c0_g1_i1:23-1432(-)